MSTATKTTTQTKLKPIVCPKCGTTHFTYQLACKRCGDYLDKNDTVMESTDGGQKVMAAAAVAFTVIGVCFLLHLF